MGALYDEYRARKRAEHAADQKVRVARESADAKAAAMAAVYAQRDAARSAELARRADAEREKHHFNAPVVRYHHDDDPAWATAVTVPGIPWDGTQLQGNIIPAGDGVLAMIYPRGHIASVVRAAAAGNPVVQEDPAWPGWVAAVAPLYTAVGERYPGLRMLRDRPFMARLSDAAGLSILYTTTEPWHGNYGSGTRRVTTAHIPSIRGVRLTDSGLRIRFTYRRGDTVALWERALPALQVELRASGFACGEPTVSQHSSGDIVLALNDQNPAENVEAPRGVTPFEADAGRSYLGVDVATGDPAFITWANHAGLLIGGAPGGGKTGSTFPIIAGLAGLAELHIFDGKGGFDYAEFCDVATTFDASGDVAAPLEALRTIATLIPLRAKAIFTATGKRDFWKLSADERVRYDLYPIFVILDEAHTWLDMSGMDAAEKKAATEIARHVRTLILKGRFCGITTILTTQKSDATAMPTRIRDNCSNRLCFRTTTTAHATTILGAAGADSPDPSKISPETPGRCVAVTDAGTVMVQAAWADEAEIAEYLKNKVPPPDQSAVARKLAGKG
jgi:S-DNA-T family DNA segregation ATPase FtsK/SpoIIIE